MPSSQYASNEILKFIATNITPARPSAWYVSLHTATPGTNGGNEVTTGNDSAYARKPVTFGTPSAQQTTNSTLVQFNAAASGASYTVTHFGVWDALTGGNFLGYGTLTTTRLVTTGQALRAIVGSLVWTHA